MRSAAYAAVLLVVVGIGAPAEAQVDEGVRLYENAEFRGALAAFDRALAGNLSRAELARLYLYRAQIQFALGETAEMMRDATRLAGLEPTYELPRAVPPQVRQAFDEAVELGAGLTLDASAEPMPGGVRITASVSGDPGDLVREIHIAARRAGDARWTEATGETFELPAPSGTAVEYRAWLVGEGNATLRETEVRTHGEVATLPPADVLTTDEEEDEGGVPVWLIVGGGVLGAALIVTTIVLIAGGGTSDDTQVGAPMYVGP